jgi:D-glycero-D-manno-heptose 1,7-bisphosphate phosphatase
MLPQVSQAALFLDRDGTLIVHKPYLHKPDEVVLLPGIVSALASARLAGFRLFLFTNQSGVGRGWFTLADVTAVHQRMLELLGFGDALFAKICVAPEAPDQPSLYRKPSPRFIQEQIALYGLDPQKCWMVGDTFSDWKAGVAAGINVAAIRSDLTTTSSETKRAGMGIPLFDKLEDAVPFFLKRA